MRNGVVKSALIAGLLMFFLIPTAAAVPVYYTGGGAFYDRSLQASFDVSASMMVNDVLMRSSGQPVVLTPGETLPGGQYFYEIQAISIAVKGYGQIPTQSGTLNFEGMNDMVWDASWSAGSNFLLSALNWTALDAQGLPLPNSLTQYAQLAPRVDLFAVLFDFSNPVTKLSMQRTPVPEPTTFILVGVGLAGAVLRRKRRSAI